MITDKIKSIFKWIGMSLEVILIAAVIIMGIILSNKNQIIKSQRDNIAILTEQVDSLSAYNKQLAEINGISVTVEFNMKSTNVLGINTNNCQNVAKEIAQYTRAELLDSLNKKK